MTFVLWFAAVYNLAWGTFVILFPTLPFQWAGLPAPNYPSIVQGVGLLIGVYGVGYWIAANDPVRYWPMVLVGLLTKILGPIGFVWTAARGEFPWAAGVLCLIDDVAWWLPFLAILLHADKVQEEQRTGLGTFRDELERAKTSSGDSLWDLSHRQPVLVVFVRHAGCTFCREAVHDVGQQADTIQQSGVKPVIVHMGSIENGRRLMKWSGRDDIESISDPDRRLFRAFELKFGTLWQLAGPYVIWRALFGGPLYKYGFGPIIGHGQQLAGVFLLDRGRIVRSYRHQTTADRPNYAELALPT